MRAGELARILLALAVAFGPLGNPPRVPPNVNVLHLHRRAHRLLHRRLARRAPSRRRRARFPPLCHSLPSNFIIVNTLILVVHYTCHTKLSTLVFHLIIIILVLVNYMYSRIFFRKTWRPFLSNKQSLHFAKQRRQVDNYFVSLVKIATENCDYLNQKIIVLCFILNVMIFSRFSLTLLSIPLEASRYAREESSLSWYSVRIFSRISIFSDLYMYFRFL